MTNEQINEKMSNLKRERTTLRRKRVTKTRMAPCSRCGGAGGYRWWPGQICYRCGGRSSMRFERVTERVYEDEELAELDRALTSKITQLDNLLTERANRERDHAIALKWNEAHDRRMERVKDTRWIGEVGERVRDLPVTVKFTKEVFNRFGASMLVTFRDEDGNTLKTFGTGSSLYKLGKEGEKVFLTGTIKSHDEWKGEKQTMFTRVKLTQ